MGRAWTEEERNTTIKGMDRSLPRIEGKKSWKTQRKSEQCNIRRP